MKLRDFMPFRALWSRASKSPQTANVFGNDNILVQAIDSVVNVTVGSPRPFLRLTQYDRRTELVMKDDSEVALLSGYRTDVVPLIGREREMKDLRRWLGAAAPVSVRVLIGAAGRGKTRLALELAREIAKAGWLAGFVTADELDRFRRDGGTDRWRWEKPVFIILDYAASRADQLRSWLRELVDASVEGRPKFRLLLLERQANREIGWLAAVFGSGDDDNSRAAISLLDPKEPIELSTIDDVEFRRRVFGALLKAGDHKIEVPARSADPQFDRLLAETAWAGDPLYLMMSGLNASRSGVRKALSLSGVDLALSVARGELARIGAIGAARGVDAQHLAPGALVRHMAVMTTLVQGLSRKDATELAVQEREALRSTASVDAAIAALTDALPAADENGRISPIVPDIIGEGAIVTWLGPKGGLVATGVDPRARLAAVARLSAKKASSTLARAAQDFAAAGYVEPVVWLDALAGAAETDLGALMEIADALPDQTLALRETAAMLAARIVQVSRDAAKAEKTGQSGDQVQSLHATSLNNLGNRLSELGRREQALVTAEEATNIHRHLVAARGDAFLPDLAMSLNNLGTQLGKLGRREEALTAAQEATEVYRRLAAARSDASLPNLATSLNNLGAHFSDLGRCEEALAAAEEATDIRRRLAAVRPDAFLPDLAMSLNNVGAFLSELGRRARRR